jgi:hypothetical protein
LIVKDLLYLVDVAGWIDANYCRARAKRPKK